VGDRFMAVGDAGCQTSPLHGGGIIPSVVAGVMAGEQAALALGSDGANAAGLWAYNLNFMRTIGHRHATHEVLRDLIYTLSADDQAFLSNVFVRAGGAVRAIREGAVFPSLAGAVGLLAPFVRRPVLARRLLRAARLMSSIRKHYLDYPGDPRGLASWAARADLLRRAI
jgi:flavin-dependent dehydrogenase